MLQYLEELDRVIEKLRIDKEDIIIVGSGAITRCGGRMNNDIEFCCNKKAYRRLPIYIKLKLLFIDHYDISENVDIFHHRYLILGLHDQDLFISKQYAYMNKYKIVIPEIEMSYKKRLMREKDQYDLANISQNPNLSACFDQNRLEVLLSKKVSIKDRVYNRLRVAIMWRYYKYVEKKSNRR